MARRHSGQEEFEEEHLQAAKAAGIPIIGVTFGYTDIPMTELECDATISHYDDFLPALDQIMPT